MKTKFILVALLAGIGLLDFPRPAVARPVATTLTATSVGQTNATLNGTVNSGGAVAAAYFQYGLTASYGTIGGFMTLPAVAGTQTLPGLVVNTLNSAATDWTPSGLPNDNWVSIASSADGMHLAATSFYQSGASGDIWTVVVTNGGVFWMPAGLGNAQWESVASSADGSHLAAAMYQVGIFTSTNYGVNWFPAYNGPPQNWNRITSSADGTQLAATTLGGGIYISLDSGNTWNLSSAPYANWQSVASSADGLRLVAAVSGGGVYTSTDSGNTWTLHSTSNFTCVASAADGSHLAAVANGGGIYVSANAGTNWNLTSAPTSSWVSIASSADGTRLAALDNAIGIYTSANGGGTWAQTGAPAANWTSVASSADGARLAAVVAGGDIYTSMGPTINLAPGTLYHYRAVGVNSAGVSLGSDLSFTTVAGAPTPTTLPATNITATGATLNGSVLTGGFNSSAFFQYGLTSGYGSFTASMGFGATNKALSASAPISNLMAGTTYHFRLVAANSAGTSYGNDLALTTSAAAPTATTVPASAITGTNAGLNGTVNPNGAGTAAYFQYGLTSGYGSYSATNTLAGTNVTLSVSNLISSLTGLTTYHFQLVASNSVGTSLGGDLSFTTGAAAPMANPTAATSITTNNATLNGTVNPNGAASSAYFQYGLTTNYGSYSATSTLPATNVSLSVSNLIIGLSAGTTYHFQLVASNSTGTTLGNDLTFTTVLAVPAATTLPASSISDVNATLNGAVNPKWGATVAYFQYGLTTSYGSHSATNSVAAGNATQSLSSLVSGLAPLTTYHFQLVAGNSAGTSVGSDLTFTTPALPAVTTLPATSVTSSNATLNGKVNPGGAQAAAWFQYGLTTSYGNVGGYMALPATNTTLTLPGLVVNGLRGAAGTNWLQTSAPTAYWQSIAASADGKRLAALVSGISSAGNIYTSTNGGQTWTLTSAPTRYCVAIASSADGLRLAAAAYGGIFISADGGLTWGLSGASVSVAWTAIASSADGMRLAAAVQAGSIYTSTNGGASWTPTSTPGTYWSSLVSSADGTRLAATVNTTYGLGLYTSADGGATWTQNSLSSVGPYAVACSADGLRLAVVANAGYASYTSTNGGLTWASSSLPLAYWTAIASSADGTRLSAGASPGSGLFSGIYTSTNAGATWALADAPSGYWSSIASSADGTQLAAVANGGGIYTSTGAGSSLTPGTTYHFQAVGVNTVGTSYGNDLTFTITSTQAVNFSLSGPIKVPGGAFQFTFTNVSGLGFSVLATTNVSLPLTNWAVLGAPVEAPPGQYQFTDPQATNNPHRYYRVRSP